VKLVGFVLLFVRLFFVWVPAALAQSPTPEPPTATPVLTQIWPGPTRTPLGDLGSCDPALTPDPNSYDLEYRFNCGHCFPKPTLSGSTSTPWPTVSFVTGTPGTAVPSGTGTPYATGEANGTATVSVTPTPDGTPTGTPEPYYWMEYLGQHPVSYVGNGNQTVSAPASFEMTGFFFQVSSVSLEGQIYCSVAGQGSTTLWCLDQNSPSYPFNGICGYTQGHAALCDELGLGLGWTYDAWGQYTWSYASLGTDFPYDVRFNQCSTCSSSVNVDVWAVYWSGDVPEPGPEGTPTPTVEAGFCSDSSGHIVEPAYQEILPLLYIRDGACLVVIPSIDAISPFIPDSWTASEWTGVQVCLQYIGMGVVKLFGYDVYMLHYLTAGAAVAIIRRIMKG